MSRSSQPFKPASGGKTLVLGCSDKNSRYNLLQNKPAGPKLTTYARANAALEQYWQDRAAAGRFPVGENLPGGESQQAQETREACWHDNVHLEYQPGRCVPDWQGTPADIEEKETIRTRGIPGFTGKQPAAGESHPPPPPPDTSGWVAVNAFDQRPRVKGIPGYTGHQPSSPERPRPGQQAHPESPGALPRRRLEQEQYSRRAWLPAQHGAAVGPYQTQQHAAAGLSAARPHQPYITSSQQHYQQALQARQNSNLEGNSYAAGQAPRAIDSVPAGSAAPAYGPGSYKTNAAPGQLQLPAAQPSAAYCSIVAPPAATATVTPPAAAVSFADGAQPGKSQTVVNESRQSSPYAPRYFQNGIELDPDVVVQQHPAAPCVPAGHGAEAPAGYGSAAPTGHMPAHVAAHAGYVDTGTAAEAPVADGNVGVGAAPAYGSPGRAASAAAYASGARAPPAAALYRGAARHHPSGYHQLTSNVTGTSISPGQYSSNVSAPAPATNERHYQLQSSSAVNRPVICLRATTHPAAIPDAAGCKLPFGSSPSSSWWPASRRGRATTYAAAFSPMNGVGLQQPSSRVGVKY